LNDKLSAGEELTEDNVGEAAENYIKLADTDGNGTIDLEELKAFFAKVEGASEDVEEIFKSLDEDGDGEISKDEFAKAIIQAVKDKDGDKEEAE